MGIVKFHSKAIRLNGLTDGLVVPTGKFKEAGVDLRATEFASTVKATKSHATKIGRKHMDSMSNPLNALRGAFTIDAYIIPDYGGVIIEKPGSFKLKYGEPFATGKITFEIHTNDGGYLISSTFDAPVKMENNSGVYSSSSNAHRPQDMTLGEQGLVLVTAQYTQKEVRCFVNGDLVASVNLGGDGTQMAENSSDIFIGGRGGEFRGIIESVRISKGVINPILQPLTKGTDTFGLWEFNDEYDTPELYFFDNARPGTPMQGRDGPDTHDGLMDIPMVGIGYDFSTTHFKIRDYAANPGGATDRYTALEMLASLTQGIELEEVRNQTWYTGTLDLTSDTYFTGVNSTVLNAVINHSGTSPITGIVTPPDSQKVRFTDEGLISTSSTSTLNPSINRVERVRITGLDFANGRINCTSVHLANDAQNGGVDNLPETQGHLFAHTNDTPVWFTLGKADLLLDPGNDDTHASVTGQRTRAKDTFTLAQFTQGQRFADSSANSNDAYFFSTKSRSTASTDANTLYEPSETYGGMGAVTSYTLMEGDFFLKMLPIPDEQKVKQTIQGIANTFYYSNDDVATASLVSENERIRVTEPTYHGSISKVINKATSVGAVESGGSNVFNRIVVEHGIGFYETGISQNLFASTRDEIVAIAVSDPKPFMLKGLDTEHTAELSNGVPTNDNYIRHLTPENKTRIAVIDSPSVLTSAGGPNKILVHYDAIDLTGEVVAGTGLANAGVSGASAALKFRKDHATGNAAYLVVRKTVPCGSAVFGGRTVSDWLRRPYSGNQTSTSAIALTITAPGGLMSLPTTTFNDKPGSHTLTSNPTGDITPSPFINIEDTVYSVGTSIGGYGRPKPVASINTPDDTSNADYHILYVTTGGATNRTSHTSTKITPSSFRRSTLCGFDVIDNELTASDHYVLVHPSNRSRYNALSDVAMSSNSPKDTATATLERTLMRGRIEEITPMMGEQGSSKVDIRGRSLLMDIADHRSSRDFNLGQGSPVKEIGDMGTPTVTMTLGGLGQGGVDIQPTYAEHPFLPGWKDKIVGAGNASVRNDKQTSTYYASTRAVTEIPLFPSMFFDVDGLVAADNDARTPLPSDKRFKMTVDCTMATNRPEMRENESRFVADWGQISPVSAFEVTDQLTSWATGTGRWLIRCQRPSVQAVVTNFATGFSHATLTVDDATAFDEATGERGLASNCEDDFYVTIGEGVLNDGYGLVAKASHLTSTTLKIHKNDIWNPLDTSSNINQASTGIDAGMTVTLGGFLVIDDDAGSSDSSDIILSINDWGTISMETCATKIYHGIKALIGVTVNAISKDPNNPNRFIILDGPNMEAFEWDPLESNESANDRQSLHPIICQTNYLALKGKKSDGLSLEYVRPLEIDFSDIANTMGDFNLCVDEVVRRINMAGHPQAKNSQGGSAFDPPPLFSGAVGAPSLHADTGTHMGYVRAFIGTNTESRDGEAGISIVIHSTVPGASGRNFNVKLSNKTPYAWKPAQVIGYGGLLASNSRLYQPNLIPSPMPIGADGESFVPISTFRGAPSGSALDSTNSIRSYNGLGSSFKVTTVASPTSETLLGVAVAGVTMTSPTLSAFNTETSLAHLAVSVKTEDYLKRITKSISSTSKGILRVGNMIADFEGIDQQRLDDSTDVMTNCFFIRNITPRDTMTDFIETFYDSDGSAIGGIEVELIYPGTDSEGIVYFGGGHTGVTFDISDGTANDYSDDFPHHYSKGPTGFSGYQNLHEVSTASAVLDFTNITNNDTINDNTLRGIHHKLVDKGNASLGRALLYVRLNEATISGSADSDYNQSANHIVEDLYGSPLRVTRGTIASTLSTATTGGGAPTNISIADSTHFDDAGTGFVGGSSFTWTGRIIGTPGQLTGVNNVPNTLNIGAEVTQTYPSNPGSGTVRYDSGSLISSNGPANSVDGTSKGLEFHANAVATHYWTGSTTNAEYGPMADFDVTEDFTISAWFKPSHSGNYTDSNEAASGPIITGKDKNGRNWGLYLAGQWGTTGDGTGIAHQQIGFHFIFHDGTNYRSVSSNYTEGIRINKSSWNNIVVKKSGGASPLVIMYLGSTGYRLGSHTSDQAGQLALTLTSINTLTGPAGGVHNANIPQNLGSSAQNKMCFIGLSTIRNLIATPNTTKGPCQVQTVNSATYSMHCGTTDAQNPYLYNTSTANNSWLWNTILSEVAIFNHVGVNQAVIFGGRSVW